MKENLSSGVCEHYMSVKLLTEYHLEFLSLKGVCTGSSEATLVKMPHCLKSHVTTQITSEIACRSLSKISQFQTNFSDYIIYSQIIVGHVHANVFL